jgi:hypothetical protein
MIDAAAACRLRRRRPVAGLGRYGERRWTKSPGCDAVTDQDNAVRGLGLARRALSATGMERGRRRTRQDQISTGA